ncbi:hypothetical protein NE236_22960 [Actinoallomurus purpureus]|uniref:hypothetical protein n=1 Tax=Actinoallomurus purpureus TaxID=478114 RepID=UPI0020927974|nr:hypothetical protein [Actinoallomurus purpureus]MCO6007844.1 hypothetical protein [Actinoallomurus purpureus]
MQDQRGQQVPQQFGIGVRRGRLLRELFDDGQQAAPRGFVQLVAHRREGVARRPVPAETVRGPVTPRNSPACHRADSQGNVDISGPPGE